MTDEQKLDEFCVKTYGAPLARLSNEALKQIQDQFGPYAMGGPNIQKSPFAVEAIGIIDSELQRRLMT